MRKGIISRERDIVFIKSTVIKCIKLTILNYLSFVASADLLSSSDFVSFADLSTWPGSLLFSLLRRRSRSWGSKPVKSYYHLKQVKLLIMNEFAYIMEYIVK